MPLKAQDLQGAIETLQAEQASQCKAFSTFTAELVAVSSGMQSCQHSADALTKQQAQAAARLDSMQAAVAMQQAHIAELLAECDRRHETAMRLQQTAATEAALLSQQVSESLDYIMNKRTVPLYYANFLRRVQPLIITVFCVSFAVLQSLTRHYG